MDAHARATPARRGRPLPYAGPADRLQELLEAATGPALLIGAHPDDIEVHAAALVLELLERGVPVEYLLVTSGGRGTDDASADPSEVARTREGKQLALAAELGVKRVSFLRFHDGELRFAEAALLEALTRELRRIRPRLAVLPDPFMNARHLAPCVLSTDHLSCGAMALEAVLVAAGTPLYYPLHARRGLAPWSTPVVLLYMTDYPDVFVEASRSWPRKLAAIAAHASQTCCRDALFGACEHVARAGSAKGMRNAEGFKVLRPTGRRREAGMDSLTKFVILTDTSPSGGSNMADTATTEPTTTQAPQPTPSSEATQPASQPAPNPTPRPRIPRAGCAC